MEALRTLLVLAGCFLLGSIPTAYLLVRLRLNKDIRQMGSGNVGTMNVRGVLGLPAALGVLVCDAAKGLAAVYLCLALKVSPDLGLAMAVAGHIYTPWLGFRGGKGLATALGGVLAVSEWQVIVVFALVWLAFFLFIWPNQGDHDNLAGAVSVIAYSLVTGPQWGLALAAGLIALKHWQAIRAAKEA